ncbi:hypothetical protein V2J09_008979 [Rumex salicifolius]
MWMARKPWVPSGQFGGTGCGRLFRLAGHSRIMIGDVEGQQICWFTANVGVCTIVETEHWGVIFGIRMAWDMRLRKIHVETDFVEAKKLLEKEAKATFNERGSSKSITPTDRTTN